MVVDVAGRVVEVLDEVSPVPGGRVVLALDLDLQRAAEAALEPKVEGEPAPMGAVVVLDVDSGDVLAMASRPAFDPNLFVGGIDTGSWKALSQDPWEPLQNRAIQTHYPPGSTHKPIVAAALLENGIVTPATSVYCPGFFRHGRRTYRCWKRAGHGKVSLHDALKQSCDVYFYTFGVQLGIDRLAEAVKSFGLGHRTGIGLANEAPGLVPTSEWKARRFGEPWYPGETVSATIGQGYNLYTTLQLAVAYAAIGNGGRVMKPRLLIRLETHDGEAAQQVEPEVVSRVSAGPETLKLVMDGLIAVVEEPGRHGGARAGSRHAGGGEDRHRAGRASREHRGHEGIGHPHAHARSRLVRRPRSSRGASRRRRRFRRARAARQQRRCTHRPARAHGLAREAGRRSPAGDEAGLESGSTAVISIDRRSLQHFDWVLLTLSIVVLIMGFAALYSASSPGAVTALPSEFRRQLLALAVGGVAFIVALIVDYRRLERLATPIFVASVLLLASTLLFAPVTRGNRSWLMYGSFSFQPAEIAKIGLVIMLARHFANRPPAEVRRIRELIPAGLIAAVPIGIIVAQRDMGVAVLTMLLTATYLPFAQIPLRSWFGLGVVGIAGLAAVWRFGLRDYQQSRVLDFLDPSRDPLSSGYQAIQSKIAIGSGGLFGKGYLEGTQTQLQFLPTQHSDFIFAVVGEEWGFLGCSLLLGCYLALLLWGLVIASSSKDAFGALLAVGLVGVLFWPAAINVAMVLGLAPVIGVPLPLVSYGGSHLLASLIALGLLMNVSMRRYVF